MMGGRKGKGKKRQGVKGTATIGGRDTVVRMTGRFIVQNSTLGTVPFLVKPALDPRLAVIATTYQEFKFLSIMVKLHSVGTGVYVVSYYKLIPVTAPTTIATAYEATCSRLVNSSDTVPQTLRVTGRDLSGGARVWYQTNPQPGDTPDDSAQGSFFIVDTVGAAKTIEFSYIVEMRGLTLPAVL